ncbi:hypothetical protein EJ110_NYTH02908 [Nymphaea thermarum]|nr:hypothetical protein EJ110_NYTH02908 [Nymphaea thermarum]
MPTLMQLKTPQDENAEAFRHYFSVVRYLNLKDDHAYTNATQDSSRGECGSLQTLLFGGGLLTFYSLRYEEPPSLMAFLALSPSLLALSLNSAASCPSPITLLIAFSMHSLLTTST